MSVAGSWEKLAAGNGHPVKRSFKQLPRVGLRKPFSIEAWLYIADNRLSPRHDVKTAGYSRCDKKRARQARHRAIVQIETRGTAKHENCPGARQFFSRAMHDHEKSVRPHGVFVVDNAVFWNARAVHGGTKRAEAASHDCPFHRGNHDRGEIAEDHNVTDRRNSQRYTANEQAPQAAPKGAALAPELDPVARVVKADDSFFSMIAFADDAKRLHRNARIHQLLHRRVGFLMLAEDGDYGFILKHRF